jgi:hypothetical protein
MFRWHVDIQVGEYGTTQVIDKVHRPLCKGIDGIHVASVCTRVLDLGQPFKQAKVQLVTSPSGCPGFNSQLSLCGTGYPIALSILIRHNAPVLGLVQLTIYVLRRKPYGDWVKWSLGKKVALWRADT